MIQRLQPILRNDKWSIAKQAWDVSDDILVKVSALCSPIFQKHGVDDNQACVSVVGSVGRHEAMNASDIDLLPIWAGYSYDFERFRVATEELRQQIRQSLKLDVSTSRDLMRATLLSDLVKPESIGGSADDRRGLTQRVLLLTESSQAGGAFAIDSVRKSLLEAYLGASRTESRHPLAVCNDIARYYRTVCMDYKSSAERKPESWCLRLVKLQGPRKFWYFTTLLSVAAAVSSVEHENYPELIKAIPPVFSHPPSLRLITAQHGVVTDKIAELLECFWSYQYELRTPNIRDTLNRVEYSHRHDAALSDGTANPFPDFYQRSRKLHKLMKEILELSNPNVREQVIDWFLF